MLTLLLPLLLVGASPVAAAAGDGFTAYGSTAHGPGALAVGRLTVDGGENPLAVTGRTPSLGWRLTSARSDVRQVAYRVRVAGSAATLAAGGADVWDSGRVATDRSTGVPYRGPAPRPGHRYHWTVKVWDNHGRSSAWSAPAHWEGALASAADWKGARWITPDRRGERTWSDVTLDVDLTLRSAAASVVLRAEDSSRYYLWQINTASTPGRTLLRPHKNVGGSFSLLKEVDVSALVPPADPSAPHHLRVRAEGSTFTTWIDGRLVDTLTDGSLTHGTIGFRTSTTGGVRESARYDNLVLRAPDGSTLFSDDFSVSPDPSFPGGTVTDGQFEPSGDPLLLDREANAPLLRRSFTLDKPIAAARAYVHGLGLYELRLNGAKVGDRVLTPANTPYERGTLYDTYDVTGALRRGANGVGLWLGTGYGPRFSPYGFRWPGPKQAVMLIDVTHTDGSHRTVTTDSSWTWSDGPVLANDLYDGEVYDARAEQPGWDTATFDDAAWHPVTTATAPAGPLTAATLPPIRVTETRPAARMTEPTPGTYVYDFGQNMAGWTRLTVRGPAGTAITLATAEELRPDGTLDTATNRDAASTDTFVLAGTGRDETYEPRFTYHGFRYVQVTGHPGRPTARSLVARVVHADVTSLATFESSSPTLDRIWRNNRWSILNNTMSTPTDNPVRDERTPPAMDVQAYRDAAVTGFGMNAFYAKYLQDLPPGTALPGDAANAQQPDMAGGQVSLARTLHQEYGDEATLRAAYPRMKAFVDKNAADHPGHIWPADRGFGDWCPPVHGPEANDGEGSPTAGACTSEVSLVNTALSYRQAADVADAARALGEPADAARYDTLAAATRRAFDDRFLNAAADTYGSGRQTTSVLPLALGMVPADRLRAVGDRLVATIVGKDATHLDTGIFGTRYLMDALAVIGRTDLAVAMLGQTTYPGFGHQIARGATSTWEQWLYRSSMETHDHAMFAGVNASFLTVLGGIRPTSPGYRTLLVAPEAPRGLDHVTATLDTVRGTVACAWRRTPGGGLHVTVTVPPNATAVVRVPRPTPDARVHPPQGARPAPQDGPTSFTLGSGEWHFTVR